MLAITLPFEESSLPFLVLVKKALALSLRTLVMDGWEALRQTLLSLLHSSSAVTKLVLESEIGDFGTWLVSKIGDFTAWLMPWRREQGPRGMYK